MGRHPLLHKELQLARYLYRCVQCVLTNNHLEPNRGQSTLGSPPIEILRCYIRKEHHQVPQRHHLVHLRVVPLLQQIRYRDQHEIWSPV